MRKVGLISLACSPLKVLRRQSASRLVTGGVILAASVLTACQAAAPEPPTLPAPSPTATRAPSPTPDLLLQGTGPDRAQQGRSVYLATCAVCHGADAEGYANELAAPALNASEHAWEHADPQIHLWIVEGKLGFGRQMPAYGDQLTDAEVHAVIAYLHSLWLPERLRMQQDLSLRWPATPEPTWTPEP
ncbi:MAG: cytochrome c [Anaerolineales bacterium]